MQATERHDGVASAAIHAAAVATVVLALYYYWFAVADRYTVFLYGHLGATPFDSVTSSRYWMAGFVAGGAVAAGYGVTVFVLARLLPVAGGRYTAPRWLSVWLLAAPVVCFGVVGIMTTANSPTIPMLPALVSAITALASLALALPVAEMAVAKPRELIWVSAAGLGLVPCLTLLRAIEMIGRGLSVGDGVIYAAALGGTITGGIWLIGVALVRAWRRRPALGALQVLAAGLCLAYVWLPLLHYVLMAPAEYRYITASSNFFATGPWLQLLVFGLATGLAVSTAKLSLWFMSRPASLRR